MWLHAAWSCAGKVAEGSHLPEGFPLELVPLCRNQILALPEPHEGGAKKGDGRKGGRSKPRDAAAHRAPRSKASKSAAPKHAMKALAQCACPSPAFAPPYACRQMLQQWRSTWCLAECCRAQACISR